MIPANLKTAAPWGGAAVLVAVAISLVGIIIMAASSTATAPSWSYEPAPLYDRLSRSETGQAWAACNRGDAIVRGSCDISQTAHVTSGPATIGGRLGWGCASVYGVTAHVRCLGKPGNWEGAASRVASSWGLASEGIPADVMSWDYYEFRNALDACLDSIEPEGP